MSESGDPREVYQRRFGERQAAAQALERRQRWLAHGRLATFALALALGWAWVARGTSIVWVGLPLGLFVVLVVLHDQTGRLAQRARRAVQFYEDGLARLELRFAGRGRSGEAFRDAEHPYLDHLDVFGTGSLYQLLCRSQTRAGARTLAGWLSAPGTIDALRERQAAVRELVPLLDLREDLAVLGPDVSEAADDPGLESWAEGRAGLSSKALRGMAAPLALLTAATGVLALLGGLGMGPFVVCVLAELALALPLRGRVIDVVGHLERPAAELELLAELLERLEREHFDASRLVELRGRLDVHGHAPSAEIARLRRRVDLLDARRNQLFAPLAPLLLWTTQLAFAIEAWRRRCGPAVPTWIETVGELEALLDLASHAFEHPADVFPELEAQGPRFEGRGLGHPLLAEDGAVRNDLRLDLELQLLVVSGSNMSGKSTLLRTIGTNTVLALAGAPVRAHALRMSPLCVGATLRILDSLADGTSRFYAEITCLRRVVERLGGAEPVLFLLDEILAGTNSHDRGIGAAAVVRTLVEAGAIGLVTTHDLALTKLVDDLAPRARNVHFEDELLEGRMVFDYRLREGVVTKSNAIALMRAVGLEV